MRIIFMGSPHFACPSLASLVGSGADVVAVYSQPPKPAGRRGLHLQDTPVASMARGFGLPIFTPLHLASQEEKDRFSSFEADLAIVVAYGLLLPSSFLQAPRHGCLNLHASLLPRWRGAAPIQRALMAGDRETGVSIMRMEKGLDTGPVALEERLSIAPNETGGTLQDKLASLGADLLVRAVGAASRETLTFKAQAQVGITYAKKIQKTEAKINWALSAQEVHNHIRALSPFPGAYGEVPLKKGIERLKVLRSALSAEKGTLGAPGELLDQNTLKVACQEGAIHLLEVQRAGRSPLEAEAFQRSGLLEKGACFR